MKKLAVILVRGQAELPQPMLDTFTYLRLYRKNTCVVVDDTPINKGMITKVKDFVTWGEISDELFKELVQKRGKTFLARQHDAKKIYSYKALEIHGKKYKPYFTLNPPRKGFERKGIKVAYAAGGALGYRGEKINDLLKRMI